MMLMFAAFAVQESAAQVAVQQGAAQMAAQQHAHVELLLAAETAATLETNRRLILSL